MSEQFFEKPILNSPYEYPGRVRLEWDAANMRVTNFEEANRFVQREARSGW